MHGSREEHTSYDTCCMRASHTMQGTRKLRRRTVTISPKSRCAEKSFDQNAYKEGNPRRQPHVLMLWQRATRKKNAARSFSSRQLGRLRPPSTMRRALRDPKAELRARSATLAAASHHHTAKNADWARESNAHARYAWDIVFARQRLEKTLFTTLRI